MNRPWREQFKAAVIAGVLILLSLCATGRAHGQERAPTTSSQDSVEQEVSGLHEQARQLMSKREFDAALPLLLRALAVAEKNLGAEHDKVVESLTYLAYLYEAQEDYARAEQMYLRALKITEKTEGTEHLNVATLLNALTLQRSSRC
jgi:tetratricopeptide (TPR) repeat protein